MELNKDNLEKWVGALESGKWEQTRGQLAEPGPGGELRLCAIGVGIAAMLKQKKKGVVEWRILSHDEEFSKWLGTPCNLPLMWDETESCVVDVNDEHEQSFPMIAQLIRKQYL